MKNPVWFVDFSVAPVAVVQVNPDDLTGERNGPVQKILRGDAVCVRALNERDARKTAESLKALAEKQSEKQGEKIMMNDLGSQPGLLRGDPSGHFHRPAGTPPVYVFNDTSVEKTE